MTVIGGINLGSLPDYLFFFADGRTDANWQGATKGFIGDVAVDGVQASERTSGGVPYAGTIYTNDATLGAWQNIINQNLTQALGATNEVARINGLEADIVSAIQQINALPASPGYASVSSTSLDGLNTQNGINEVFVINITSGLNFSTKINITGDAGDVFILRWDTDGDPTNGYQGQVKPQSGGAIVPLGGLTPTNFINVAGDINASGGGTTPLPPYPQGPRYDDGQGALIIGGSDFAGGGFFTGYWLTTGSPDQYDAVNDLWYGETSPLSNGIFVGGWYTITTKFSMTSGTSGVYVSPNPATTAQPSIHIEKFVSPDGGLTWFDADTPPGPSIPQGTNPRYRFVVTNTGNVTLTNITVVDSVLGPITIPTTTLAPGGTFTVEVNGTWALGQHMNVATATGDYDGVTYSDDDPAHYVGVLPSIDIEKYVSPDNGVTWYDADTPPGPSIPQGTNPRYRFVVTNTGTVPLNNITVVDSVLGPITIPTTTLAPGESFSVEVTGTWALGLQTNVATVTGNYNGQPTTDTDPANYTGVEAAIDIEKFVSPDGGATWFDADTPPGPTIPQGTNPRFRFVVTNIGSVPLINITVVDSALGPITIPTTTLAPGESFTVEVTGTWALGLQTNVAVATGYYNGQPYIDEDPANYTGVEAAIDIEKYVSPDGGATWFDADTPPGPTILPGINPRYRFVVTNTGSVTLINITVVDTVLGPITTPATTLAPGESFTVEVTGTWAVGQQANVAVATGYYNGQPYTDTDPAHYFGANPVIDIEKYVSPDGGATWFDADFPPGPAIPQGTTPRYRFVVTNTGNVTLTNITVVDTVLGSITIPATTLAPGASFTVEVNGTWGLGQQVNVATVAGDYNGVTYFDEDPAYYLGVEAAIDIEKYISPDGGTTWFDADFPPGPSIVQGTNPRFRFVVTNTGNATLTNITVTDTALGPITIPTTTLAPGESFTVEVTGTWFAGQQMNVATVTGFYNNEPYTDSDPAHYVGVPREASVNIKKYVSPDGGATWYDADTPPGPSIPQGTNPKFRFVVTNTGSFTLTNISVIDTALGPITIPTTTLAPGESFTVEVTGTWFAGQQMNVATVTGQYNGQTVTDTDPAHYVGVTAAINIKKYVSPDCGATWYDADTPPGPSIPQGTNPKYRFVVTNTGAVTLTNITLTDSVLGPIAIPTTSLSPGETFTVQVTGTWAIGQQMNLATVTGFYDNQPYSDTDPAHYYGRKPGIDVEKYVSVDGGTTWVDADTPPGPHAIPGIDVMFKFVVTNIGNDVLTNVTVTDNKFGLIGTLPSLAPGASHQWIITP